MTETIAVERVHAVAARVAFCVLMLASCSRAAPVRVQDASPAAPGPVVRVSSRRSPRAPAPVPSSSDAGQTGPGVFHWVNPQPQGATLSAVSAGSVCGVIAVGDEGTIMRSLDDGITWGVHQWRDAWDFQFATLVDGVLYAVARRREESALVRVSGCGADEPKILQTFARKIDGDVDDIAADGAGHVYLTTLLHKRGRVLCSSDMGVTLRVCDDRPTPLYAMFVNPAGVVWIAGGDGGAEGE